MKNRILSAAVLAGSVTSGASAVNIALNTTDPWKTYGDKQEASSTMWSHSYPTWAFDGNIGSYPWISGPSVNETPINPPPHWIYTTWTVDATVDSVTVKPYKDGEYTTQEFQIQTLNLGGNAGNDSDWTTVYTVSDVGIGTDTEPYINDASFTFTPAAPITTRGIRTYITVPSEFWQDGTYQPNYGQERARIDEIIVDGSISPPPSPSIWAVDAAGDWNKPANWGGTVPGGIDAKASLLGVITAPRTVYADDPVTVGTLELNNANRYHITGNGSLTIETSAGSGLIDVQAGSQKINLPLFFASNTSVAVASGADLLISDPVTVRASKTVTKSGAVTIEAPLTLEAGATLVTASGPTSVFGAPSLGAGAKIDLKNNSMTVDYRGQASPATTIKGQIAAAGIMSSSATATTGLGWKDDAASQSILVKYTYLGDTNLDGQVDVIDLGNLATAWQTSGVWVNGDSNYDDFVDVIDLGLLATNWQAGVGSPLGPGSLDQALAAYGLPSVSVPEPAMLGMMLLGGAAMLRRSRRQLS